MFSVVSYNLRTYVCLRTRVFACLRECEIAKAEFRRLEMARVAMPDPKRNENGFRVNKTNKCVCMCFFSPSTRVTLCTNALKDEWKALRCR